MSNSKEQYVLYKHYPPAVVRGAEKKGRKIYLLLVWTNYAFTDKWVKASVCKEYFPGGSKSEKGLAIPVPFSRGKVGLNWFQRIVVDIQNWWYKYKYRQNDTRKTH